MRRRDFIRAVGAAGVGWPLVARAQQSGNTYRMAVVDPSRPVSVWSETGGVPPREAFFKELRALGYEPDRNLHVERYSGEGNASRFAELAREVVGSNPDVIVTVSTRMALHFKEATSVIPIVAVTVDPIIAGLVPSLAQPGGNITGVSIEAGSMAPKLVEIVTEAFPGRRHLGLLVPRSVWSTPYGQAFRRAAQQAHLRLHGAVIEAPADEPDFRRAFALMADARVDHLIVADAAENFTRAGVIISEAQRYRLPALYPERSFAQQGGLFSYGVDYVDLYRHAARNVSAIFAGRHPREIPYYQATKFELIINLNTAKAQGLTLPPTLLVRADEVIN